MRLEKLCRNNPVTLEKTATLRYAATLMRREHVGTVVVTERREGVDVPIGILTDRDIVIKGVAESRDLDGAKVSDVMSDSVQTISPNDDIDEAISRMQRAEVRRLVMKDELGAICGIVSADDILAEVGCELGLLGSLFKRQVKDEKRKVAPAERRLLFE